MRIHRVEITNFKAFLGSNEILPYGKNCFIYGENGSGKSSLYYALKDFFQASMEEIDLSKLENLFVLDQDKGSVAVKVTFKANNTEGNSPKEYTFSLDQNDTRNAEGVFIRDANKLKSFITYKHLLGIHHLKKDDSIDLFDLLVLGVLAHYTNPLTDGQTLGDMWEVLVEQFPKVTNRSYNFPKKKHKLNQLMEKFNVGFGELFREESPEYILKNVKPLLREFDSNIDIRLRYKQVTPEINEGNPKNPWSNYMRYKGGRVEIDVYYAGKKIDKPHLFLNEARLSAVAISIYLGMIKGHPQLIACKILFLDDLFIGLDISNRMPLLKILNEHFSDYQIFLTTYDKPWFEYAKTFLQGKEGWKTMEFYARKDNDGVESPVIFDDKNLLDKAEKHLSDCDYKSAAVYTRSAFEETLQRHCDKTRKPVKFRIKQKKYTSDDFWGAIRDTLEVDIINKVELYRELVLNSFSHYNSSKHEIKTELEKAIEVIKELNTTLEEMRNRRKRAGIQAV